jgi:AbrB family looped-hinge helix DNA binding protein
VNETTVTVKGQVTIPAAIRVRLGIKPRDKVTFELNGDTATMKKARSGITAGYGSIKPRSRPEDFRKLREEFERGVAKEVMSETER